MPSTTTEATRLLLVGCGKMGGALLEGALAKKPASLSIYVVEPSPRPAHLKSVPGLVWVSAPEDVAPDFVPNLIVIAVKPQQIDKVLPAYGRFRNGVFLSIAAGITLARLEKLLGGTDYAIVRAMPNLPASIGQGISGLIANTRANPAQRALCGGFIENAGEAVWLEDEKFLDIVTAFSGGPAYVFALCEAMAKAGEALGLPAALAMQFARKTVAGSGGLLAQSQESPEALRSAVTSPAGTTEAALKFLLATDGLDDLVLKALTASVKRAKELAQ